MDKFTSQCTCNIKQNVNKLACQISINDIAVVILYYNLLYCFINDIVVVTFSFA